MITIASKIQQMIDDYKERGEWIKLHSLLLEIIKDYPDEYYFLTELSSVCYQLNLPSECLNYAERAYKIAVNDLWVTFHYGMALYLNDDFEESQIMFSKIISTSVEVLAYGEHGEGLKWAKSLINDSRYMIARCMMQQQKYSDAEIILQEHISKRKRGLYSDFSKRQALNHLQYIQQKIENSGN